MTVGRQIIRIDPPYPKQVEFFKADAKYIAYGGARGGGKSWAARTKAMLLALNYSGMQILLLRRTFPELRQNHIIPLKKMLAGAAVYRESEKAFNFPNGSRIVLGYCAAEADVLQYQGQAYDVIFMEEATQFTEFQFQSLTECSRASGLCRDPFSPRMYFTCNPGGVGHTWVKRLFIDRDYRNRERAEDYTFIQSLVYENRFLMDHSPDYVRTLENLPVDRRRAMLYGDWDIFQGQYFPEFRREIHTVEPFVIPKDWKRYFTMDYGLDMLAGYFVAVAPEGRAYFYKEIYENGLIISEACKRIKERTDSGEHLEAYFAPPDLWNRRQETGKSAAELFREGGILLWKANNDRVQGWLNVKEWLKPYPNPDEDGGMTANLQIFRSCSNLIRCLPAVQYSDKNPNDVSTEPHELTHSVDAVRYFIAGRPTPFQRKTPKEHPVFHVNRGPSADPLKGGEIHVI